MGSIKVGWTQVGTSDRSRPDRSKSDRSKSDRSRSDRSKNLNPDQRAQIEQSRKRFQCDLLEFWRQCRRTGCRQGHRCTGDPFDCFRRRYAAMPRDHEDFWRATLLSRTAGIGTAEKVLRTVGLAMPRGTRPEAGNLPPPHKADAAATAVVPVQENDASRLRGRSPLDAAEARQAREAEIVAKLSPEGIAALEKSLGALGMTLQREIAPEHEAVAAAPAVVPADIATPETDPPGPGMDAVDAADMIEWSPMTGSSVDPVRAAALPPPAARRETGPVNQLQDPLLACCDEEGRLIIPDRTEHNERLRQGLSWSEIVARGRV